MASPSTTPRLPRLPWAAPAHRPDHRPSHAFLAAKRPAFPVPRRPVSAAASRLPRLPRRCVERFWQLLGAEPSWAESKLELRSTPDRGRGWFAKEPVEQGEVVLSVPWEKGIAVPLEGASEGVMAVELLRKMESDEMWSDYVREFFPSRPQSAAFWPDEMMEGLEWPPAVEIAQDYSEQLKMAVSLVTKFYGSGTGEEGEEQQASGADWERAAIAVNAVATRSLPFDDEERVLFPLFDLFNHRPQSLKEMAAGDPDLPFTAWSRSEDGSRALLTALRPANKGEEVSVTYLGESNAELLTVHGFVPENNVADVVELFTDIEELAAYIESVRKEKVPDDRLEELFGGLAAEAPLAVRPGGVAASLHLVATLEAALCTDEEFAEFTEDWNDDVGHAIWQPGHSMPQARRIELRAEALQYAVKMADGALRHMAPLEEDEEMLQEMPEAPSEFQAEVMQLSLQFRIATKKLLQDFVDSAMEG